MSTVRRNSVSFCCPIVIKKTWISGNNWFTANFSADKIGNTIYGTNSGSNFGISSSIDDDGIIISVGEYNETQNIGNIHIYERNIFDNSLKKICENIEQNDYKGGEIKIIKNNQNSINIFTGLNNGMIKKFNINSDTFSKINTDISNGSNGDLLFHTRSNNILNEKMRIGYNGNVGIGIKNPATLLDISGDTTIRSNIYITSNNSGIIFDNNSHIIKDNSNNILFNSDKKIIIGNSIKNIHRDSNEDSINLNNTTNINAYSHFNQRAVFYHGISVNAGVSHFTAGLSIGNRIIISK